MRLLRQSFESFKLLAALSISFCFLILICEVLIPGSIIQWIFAGACILTGIPVIFVLIDEIISELQMGNPMSDCADVIRCKDCKWWVNSEYAIKLEHDGLCARFKHHAGVNGFCCWAERRKA